MKKGNKTLGTTVIGVKQVLTDSLRANPHNPRILFDREPLKTLEASIVAVGILVPLTVYRDSRRKCYIILDGQRRWTCAKNIGLAKVPVNEVAEPSLVQNIVTMFQIHRLREDWELMPTALKLELLMKELKERNDKKLAVLTSLPESVVSRCKKLLSYPKRFQDQMLDPDPNRRLKADFFIELYPVIHDREVSKMEWFSRNTFTDQMLEKHGPGKPIRSVIDFRKIKQHINNAKKSGKISQLSRRLKIFSENEDKAIDYLHIESAHIAQTARKLTSNVAKLTDEIRRLDAEKFYGEEVLWKELTKLLRAIQVKLKKADRRFE